MDVGRGRGRGKRLLDAAPSDGKARFYRNDHGELCVLKPGEKHPDERDDVEKYALPPAKHAAAKMHPLRARARCIATDASW